jgi:hypothetical protein
MGASGDQNTAAQGASPVIRTGIAFVLVIAVLAACGLRGDLERPVPMWGNPPNEGANDPRTIKAREEEEKRKEAEKEAARNAPAQPATPAQPAPQ